MLIEAIILPLIIGKLSGGKFENLLDIKIRIWWLITAAGLIEFGAVIIRSHEIGSLWLYIAQNVFWIQFVTYSLIIVALSWNIKEKGFNIIMIGLLLNFIVIMLNHGKMPVDIQAIKHLISEESLEYLRSGKDLTHIIASDSTRLWFLGDIIHLRKPYPLTKSISIGDLFLTVGLLRFIFCKMKSSISQGQRVI